MGVGARDAGSAARVQAFSGIAGGWWVYGALAVAWEGFSRLVGSATLAPGIGAIVRALVELVKSGQLWQALWWSLSALVLGFGLGAFLGMGAGVLMGGFGVVDRALSPYANALYATPLVALVPVIVLWFGIGLWARVTFIAVWVLFPVLISTFTGMRAAEARLTEVARSFGASRGQLWWHVLLPYTAPFLFAGLRLAAGRALVGLLLAETFLQSHGLGALLAGYGASYSTDYVFAIILVLPLLHWGLVGVIKAVEHRVLRWHPAITTRA